MFRRSETRLMNDRNSVFELLRIISMLMIISYHMVDHGNIQFEHFDARLAYALFFRGLGKIGVDLFVLISGYFLINDDSGKSVSGKLVKMWGQMMFYSLFSVLAAVITGSNLTLGYIGRSIFPFSSEMWWFATVYFVLYALHPYLNIALRSLSRERYLKITLFMTVIWSVIPIFLKQQPASSNLAWFICLYAIAGYIRLYNPGRDIERRHYIITACGVLLLSYCFSIITAVFSEKYTFLKGYVFYLYDMNKLTTLVVSICLFMIAVRTKPFCSHRINTVSSYAFGVYLLHENVTMRALIWGNISARIFNMGLLTVPLALIVPAAVYAVGSLIEVFRKNFCERIFIKASEHISKKLKPACDRICAKVFKAE